MDAYRPNKQSDSSDITRVLVLGIRTILRIAVAAVIIRWIIRIAADARVVNVEYVFGQVVLAAFVAIVAFWTTERIWR